MDGLILKWLGDEIDLQQGLRDLILLAITMVFGSW